MPWTKTDENEWELVIPNERLYMLSAVDGDYVNVNGERVDGVEWMLDFSRMVDGEIQSKRSVTQDALAHNEAREWAKVVAAEWCLGYV